VHTACQYGSETGAVAANLLARQGSLMATSQHIFSALSSRCINITMRMYVTGRHCHLNWLLLPLGPLSLVLHGQPFPWLIPMRQCFVSTSSIHLLLEVAFSYRGNHSMNTWSSLTQCRWVNLLLPLLSIFAHCFPALINTISCLSGCSFV